MLTVILVHSNVSKHVGRSRNGKAFFLITWFTDFLKKNWVGGRKKKKKKKRDYIFFFFVNLQNN